MSLVTGPLSKLARALRAKEVSSREITQAYLERIARIDGKLGSYLLVDGDNALRAADAADAALARGEAGPLTGVPIALKDIFVTKGTATTVASKILAGWVPPYDGTVVARLRAAGAVLLGKLNMDEFAMGSSNENSSVKPCRNPWDLERVPGGSSGGSAAAVAAGLCAAALGTDTGGSIRTPAAFTGIVGLKPTYGRVSRYGVVAFASSLDQVGPMTRTVEDSALLMEVIGGHDPLDSTSIDQAQPKYTDACKATSLDGLRVGLPAEYFGAGIEPEVEAAVRAAIAQLEKLGARVVPVSLPYSEYAVACYYILCTAEAASNLARYDGVRFGLRVADKSTNLLEMYRATRGAGFGPEVKRRIMLGTYALRSGYYDAYYGRAQKVRALIKRDFDRAFAECDVIATPASPTAAFKLGEKSSDPLAMYLADIYTISCNLAGIPGISVPCGFTTGNLPIGLQLLGPALAEPVLFRTAAAYERATDWHTRRAPEVAS